MNFANEVEFFIFNPDLNTLTKYKFICLKKLGHVSLGEKVVEPVFQVFRLELSNVVTGSGS